MRTSPSGSRVGEQTAHSPTRWRHNQSNKLLPGFAAAIAKNTTIEIIPKVMVALIRILRYRFADAAAGTLPIEAAL